MVYYVFSRIDFSDKKGDFVILSGIRIPFEMKKVVEHDLQKIKDDCKKPNYDFRWRNVSRPHVDMYNKLLQYFFSNANIQYYCYHTKPWT